MSVSLTDVDERMYQIQHRRKGDDIWITYVNVFNEIHEAKSHLEIRVKNDTTREFRIICCIIRTEVVWPVSRNRRNKPLVQVANPSF